ncbi:MAG: DUF4136 domain-containing protein [Holophaga sp.]|nr:DUF4136 domain-containing protein [Holophaga sp.]
MGLFRSMMVAGVLAGLAGCAGPEVHYDYDAKANFAGYQTYDWLAAPKRAAARGGAFDTAIMNNRVKRAVGAALAAKGYRLETGADPDFLVSYYPVRKGDRSHQVHLGLGLGMGPMGVGVGAPVGSRHAESVGSMVLEIQDFRTKTVVWKATAEKVLESSDSPEEADDAVKSAVTGMLKKFPPKP